MTSHFSSPTVSPLRQRLIDDMNVRRFGAKTQHDYLHSVSRFAAFLGRSPATAMAEDIRRFQVAQHEAGMDAPAMNSDVSALRFFFTTPWDTIPSDRVPLGGVGAAASSRSPAYLAGCVMRPRRAA